MVKYYFTKDNNVIFGRGVVHLISYAPLWETMQKRGETTYTLISKHGINARTVNNLKHNRSITMFTLERLCQILNCQAESIVTFTPDTP